MSSGHEAAHTLRRLPLQVHLPDMAVAEAVIDCKAVVADVP